MQSKHREGQSVGKRPANWWTPVWRGLVADPESKHRKAMGPAIWLYLYLLAYANRKTGIVRRTQQMMANDTGYSLGTIQAGLRRLRNKDYLTKKYIGRYLEIRINKWKGFSVRKEYYGKDRRDI